MSFCFHFVSILMRLDVKMVGVDEVLVSFRQIYVVAQSAYRAADIRTVDSICGFAATESILALRTWIALTLEPEEIW